MKEIIEKLSTYNIFNYLLPGVLFVIISKSVIGYDFIQENNLLGAFLYYFIGMIISRFGSLIVEPVLRKFKFLKYSDYKDFINATKKDAKIELLSEINNTYRTLLSMVIILLLLKFHSYCSQYFNIEFTISLFTLVGLIAVLFLFAYRKQTGFIVKRIESNNQK